MSLVINIPESSLLARAIPTASKPRLPWTWIGLVVVVPVIFDYLAEPTVNP